MDDNLFENTVNDIIATDMIFDFLIDIIHTNFSCKRKYRDRKFHNYCQYSPVKLAMGVGVSRALIRILKHGGQKI